MGRAKQRPLRPHRPPVRRRPGWRAGPAVDKSDLEPIPFLHTLFQAALAAANPVEVTTGFLHQHQPWLGTSRTVVVGAGKAAAAMASAVERVWPADADLHGLVVTRYGHGVPVQRIEVIEAGHPVPDSAGLDAARRTLALVQGLSEDDLVLCLLSGGGSALLTLPALGLTLADKRTVTQALLASGAKIGEINCVRKHLSAIKGGRLATAAYPARVLTLAISDVPGDDPSVIASGPTVADRSSFTDAVRLLKAYRVRPPDRVDALLAAGIDETPKPDDPRLARSELFILLGAKDALTAARTVAESAGLKPVVVGEDLMGEAREVARSQAGLALSIAREGSPEPKPAVLITGGETTVTVRGSGQGGPNTEYLLALAIALGGQDGVYALAADTDGIDGTEDNAGAWIGPDTLARARALGFDPRTFLDNNDAYSFFATLGDLVITGPTRTNVNDFRAILVL